jgi:hypothetical protein
MASSPGKVIGRTVRAFASLAAIGLLSPPLILAGSAVAEGPALEKIDAGLRIRSRCYRAEIAAAGGGLIARVDDRDGRPLVGRLDIYTDVGIYDGHRFHGASNEIAARLCHVRRGKEVAVTAEGTLRDVRHEAPATSLLHYRAEMVFDDSAAIRVSIVLAPDFNVESPQVFLAHAVALPDAAEIFARTSDGLLCQDAATRSARTWQSARDPLDPERPAFGVCTSRRSCVALTNIRSQAGLANVFVHENSNRSLSAYFAWSDGMGQAKIARRRPLDLAYTILVDGYFPTAGK